MLKSRLLELPDEIRKMRLELLEDESKLLKVKNAIAKWELEQMSEIVGILDEKGKPLYSNDMKRKAELERRKAGDEYIEIENTINQMEAEINKKKIDLETLYNEQKNLRAICLLEGDE